jgi:hypothetical protein
MDISAIDFSRPYTYEITVFSMKLEGISRIFSCCHPIEGPELRDPSPERTWDIACPVEECSIYEYG